MNSRDKEGNVFCPKCKFYLAKYLCTKQIIEEKEVFICPDCISKEGQEK